MSEFYRDKMERLEHEAEDQLVQEAYEVGKKEQLNKCIVILKAKYDQCGEDMKKTHDLQTHTKLFNQGQGISQCIAALKDKLAKED